jgi:selenocysteine lyase/cysteine desulfurase
MSFILPPGGPYLLSHSVGCQPATAKARLEGAYLAPWAEQGGGAWPAWLATIERFRAALAGLLGGEARDFCPKPNLSAALFSLIAARPFDAARPVILASAHMFPSLGFAAAQCARLGYRLELLPAAADPGELAVWEQAMGGEVGMVVAMHVHSNSGVVAPVPEICALAQARGIFSVIDVAQSAGVVPIDLALWKADSVIGSCVKWLCGGPGAGWLWIDPAVLPRLEPLDVGWFSHADPFEFDIEDFRYAPDARRFWGGTPSVAPYAAATAGIEAIAAIGVETVWRHNRALITRLSDRLPPDILEKAHRGAIGGTLCLALPEAAAALTAAGCRFDRRGDTLRLSFHIYNTEGDADRVAECLPRR